MDSGPLLYENHERLVTGVEWMSAVSQSERKGVIVSLSTEEPNLLNGG